MLYLNTLSSVVRSCAIVQWIVEKQAMPSIILNDLLDSTAIDQDIKQGFDALIKKKAQESEKSNLVCLTLFMTTLSQSTNHWVKVLHLIKR